MTEFFRFSHQTRYTEETAAVLSDRYGRVSVGHSGVTMREEHLGDYRFTFSTVDLIGGFQGRAELSGGFSVVQPILGSGAWQVGRLSVAVNTPLLLQPEPPVTIQQGDVRNRVLTLDLPAFEATARALYGDDDLVLQFDADPRPVDARAGSVLDEIPDLAAAVQDSLDHELVRSSVYRTLAITTLETFRLAGDSTQRRETATGLLHAYTRAVSFFDSNASLPITVLDAAADADVSLAQLRAAFRAQSPLGLTPEHYLRRTRLAAAHTDLRAADPTRGDTVRAIAIRWGFPDPSRFARHYRTAYGVNPRWTLDR